MIEIPETLESRVEQMEQIGEKLFDNNYTLQINLFADGDAHLKIVHSASDEHEFVLHEGRKKVTEYHEPFIDI